MYDGSSLVPNENITYIRPRIHHRAAVTIMYVVTLCHYDTKLNVLIANKRRNNVNKFLTCETKMFWFQMLVINIRSLYTYTTKRIILLLSYLYTG